MFNITPFLIGCRIVPPFLDGGRKFKFQSGHHASDELFHSSACSSLAYIHKSMDHAKP